MISCHASETRILAKCKLSLVLLGSELGVRLGRSVFALEQRVLLADGSATQSLGISFRGEGGNARMFPES